GPSYTTRHQTRTCSRPFRTPETESLLNSHRLHDLGAARVCPTPPCRGRSSQPTTPRRGLETTYSRLAPHRSSRPLGHGLPPRALPSPARKYLPLARTVNSGLRIGY